jgi:hypothetical protein
LFQMLYHQQSVFWCPWKSKSLFNHCFNCLMINHQHFIFQWLFKRLIIHNPHTDFWCLMVGYVLRQSTLKLLSFWYI